MSLVKDAIIRGIIPLVIMSVISYFMQEQGNDSFQVRSTFLVGLIISVVAATTVIYEIENWSLTKQSVIHFTIMLVTVFPLLMISGWFPLNRFLDYAILFGVFLLVGLILWGINYFIYTIKN